MTIKKLVQALVTIMVPLIIWLMPNEYLPISGLSIMEQRVLAIFSFAVLSWVLEPIPIFATSVVIIFIEILTLSDGGIAAFTKPLNDVHWEKQKQNITMLIEKESQVSNAQASKIVDDFLASETSLSKSIATPDVALTELQSYKIDEAGQELKKSLKTHKKGGLMKSKSLMGNYAHPIIMLFLGGFFLAASATKFRLDMNLARVLVKPFGTKPAMVTLGIMLITAVFSMFMSNTACTAMMLAIVAPILNTMDTTDKGRIAMALSVPLAANIGGMGTPIGTPPNAVAMKYLTEQYAISFDMWMLFAIPLVIVLLTISWFLLIRLYPSQKEAIQLQIKGKFLKTPQAIVVYVTFASTILLWVTAKLHGIPSTVVALLPVGVFVCTGVMTAKDIQKLSWDVLWLMAGGFALGAAINQSGLSASFINSIPFETMPAFIIILVAAVVTMLMATFMSNTATANLLLPIMATLGMALGDNLANIGGYQGLVVGVTLSASLGLALPISTPPNAMAHATGFIDTKAMAKVGTIMSIIGIVAILSLIFVLKSLGFAQF